MLHRTHQPFAINQQMAALTGKLVSFLLAAGSAFALTMSVAFYDSFSSLRLGAVLVLILLLHIQVRARVLFTRESAIYTCFVAYMLFSLLWTEDDFLALNTLVPAVNFVIILVLFGSLVTFHSLHAVLAGFFWGVLAGAIGYTVVAGFPFVYPAGFSYNAIALLYVFGLFVTLLLSCFRRSKILPLTAALCFLLFILATTSIKTNLGVVVGVMTALLVYFAYFGRVLAKNMVPLALLAGLLSYGLASNDALFESAQRGFSRASLGVEILQSRESAAGYGGAESRRQWFREGITGWAENPVFGYGVEAFRSRVGITSHSTPVDLLYNSGLIGLVLFYSIFLSIAWRLFVRRNESPESVNALILGTFVCFLFITLLGTMHYSTFLAAFIAVSVSVLRGYRGQEHRAGLVGERIR